MHGSAESTDSARLIRRAKALSWLSLGWMTVEGAVGVAAAVAAGSVAMLGFGLDSTIEALASVIVIWRFSGRRRLSDAGEERAQRLVRSASSYSRHTSRRTRCGR
jgi:divalent metal cation (Fe/Co/Zn/Cd) transporter